MPYRIRDLRQAFDAPGTTVAQHRELTHLLEAERDKAQAHYDEVVGSTWARLTSRIEDFDEGVPRRGGIPAKSSITEVTKGYRQLAKDAGVISIEEYERRMAELDRAMDDLTDILAGMRRDVDAIDRTENGPPGFQGEWGPEALYDAFLDRNPVILHRGERSGFDYDA
jgi:phage shock protein A